MFPDAPAAVELYRSLDGSSFAATGATPVGCYAQTAVAAGGAVQFDGANTVVCSGYAGSVGGLYAFSETSRAVFQARPPAGKAYFGFKRAAEQGGYQFPEMDESLYVAVPPTGIVVTNTAESVAKEYWVDPDSGSDENAGTSSAAPLKTLAQAVDLLSPTVRTLVHCAAGDYAEGAAAEDANGKSRLAILDYRTLVRFKGAGRGVSFISGAPDPNSVAAGGDGRGPKAVRCVYIAGSSQGPCAIQGFTLRTGYADAGDTADSTSERYQGGLVWNGASTTSRQVIDCELVGGLAYRGGIAMRGVFTRDIFRDTSAFSGGALRGATVRSSVFYGHTGLVLAADNTVRQSTISSTNGVSVLGRATLICSALQATGCTADLEVTGFTGVCYSFDNGKKLTGGTEGESYFAREPRFVDFVHDDLRLRSDSSLVTAPVPVDADYWKAPATDVNGVPFSYKGGKTVAGGLFTPVPVLVVEKPAFGEATHVGANVVEVGESVTVDFTPSTKRRLEAILVNGEPVEGTSYTFAPDTALADDGAPIPSATLAFLFSTNWYVNATAGNDAHDGFTSETPWRTLAKIATSGLMLPGDCVHAAAGAYDAETAVPSTDADVGECRVVLPTGVTLVADEGADMTRIVGAVGRADLCVDRRDVFAHAVRRQVELKGDVGVREAARHRVENALLPFGQRADGRRRLQHLPDLRADDGLAGDDAADGVDKLAVVDGLQQRTVRAGLQGAGDAVRLDERREDDDFRLRARRDDFGRGRRTVHLRHDDVHENHVRPQRRGLGHGFASVFGIAHDVEAGIGFEDGRKPHAHEGMVVGDQDLGWFGHGDVPFVSGGSSSEAMIFAPAPGRLSTVSWPRKRRRRSRTP